MRYRITRKGDVVTGSKRSGTYVVITKDEMGRWYGIAEEEKGAPLTKKELDILIRDIFRAKMEKKRCRR